MSKKTPERFSPFDIMAIRPGEDIEVLVKGEPRELRGINRGTQLGRVVDWVILCAGVAEYDRRGLSRGEIILTLKEAETIAFIVENHFKVIVPDITMKVERREIIIPGLGMTFSEAFTYQEKGRIFPWRTNTMLAMPQEVANAYNDHLAERTKEVGVQLRTQLKPRWSGRD